MKFIHNNPSDVWFRKYGTSVYFGAILLVIGLAPGRASWAPSVLAVFEKIPALHALIDSTIFPGKIAAWLLASVMLYPVAHLIIRSRMLNRDFDSRILMKLFLAVLALDCVLFILAAYGSYSVSMVGVGGRMFRLLATDLFGILVLGAALSFVYSIGIAMTWLSVSIAIKRN